MEYLLHAAKYKRVTISACWPLDWQEHTCLECPLSAAQWQCEENGQQVSDMLHPPKSSPSALLRLPRKALAELQIAPLHTPQLILLITFPGPGAPFTIASSITSSSCCCCRMLLLLLLVLVMLLLSLPAAAGGCASAGGSGCFSCFILCQQLLHVQQLPSADRLCSSFICAAEDMAMHQLISTQP
jgi:hypothetical protein